LSYWGRDLSALDLIVQVMVNPSVLRQLGKEHEREILEASRIPRAAGSMGSRVRERLGWSLIGLGAHLALNGGGPPESGRLTNPRHRTGSAVTFTSSNLSAS
jgi:hypothetical protein